MAFCSNCGNEITGESGFCGNCGKSTNSEQSQVLQSEQVEVAIEQPMEQVQQMHEQAPAASYNMVPPVNTGFQSTTKAVDFASVLSTLKDMLMKPATAVSEAKERFNVETTMFLMGVLTLVYALVNIWSISAIMRAIKHSIGGGFGYYSGMFNFSDLPYIKLFFLSLLIFAFAMVVLTAVIYVLSQFFMKCKGDLLRILNITVVASIPYVVSLIIQTILMYISVKLGLVVGLVGVIVSFLAFYKGISEELQTDENKLIFSIPIAYFAMILVSYLLTKIFF